MVSHLGVRLGKALGGSHHALSSLSREPDYEIGLLHSGLPEIQNPHSSRGTLRPSVELVGLTDVHPLRTGHQVHDIPPEQALADVDSFR